MGDMDRELSPASLRRHCHGMFASVLLFYSTVSLWRGDLFSFPANAGARLIEEWLLVSAAGCAAMTLLLLWAGARRRHGESARLLFHGLGWTLFLAVMALQVRTLGA